MAKKGSFSKEVDFKHFGKTKDLATNAVHSGAY
jgi:hypothetical protein